MDWSPVPRGRVQFRSAVNGSCWWLKKERGSGWTEGTGFCDYEYWLIFTEGLLEASNSWFHELCIYLLI